MEFLDVIGSGNIHRCREIEPFEAAVYGLQAEKLETFSAISKTKLTLAADEESFDKEYEEKRKDFSSLELPVVFSKETVTMVITQLAFYS